MEIGNRLSIDLDVKDEKEAMEVADRILEWWRLQQVLYSKDVLDVSLHQPYNE